MDINLFLLVIWYIHDVISQSTQCGSQHKPVVGMCKENNFTTTTVVYITTKNVPIFAKSVCTCSITSNTSHVNTSFSFVDDIVPQSLSFRINGIILDSKSNSFTFNVVIQILTLLVPAIDSYTREGGCLMISTKIPFNISCNRSNTTMPVSNLQSSVKPNKDKDNKTDTYVNQIIVPVVASIAIVVCLVIVIVVICCRRRTSKKNKQPKTSNLIVSKTNVDNNDDDNYMTENPMYERGPDNVMNADASDDEYHYTEPDKPSNHITDGSRRFPYSKQFQENVKTDHNHYEYSTCLASSLKRNSSSEIKTRHSNINLAIIENSYDTTDTVSSRQFEGFNVYHKLGKVGQTNVAIVDTYNTIGNTRKHPKDENQE